MDWIELDERVGEDSEEEQQEQEERSSRLD
jgi:hypothetical protein